MAWIEVHQALLTHRKTLRLGRLLHLDTFAVVGRLMALWCWALDNAPDGTVSAQDSDLLADVMGWDGTPDELCGALVTAGFLETGQDGYIIHDWHEYGGKLITLKEATRAANARRQEDARAANARRQQDWRDRHKAATEQRNANNNVTEPLRNRLTEQNRTEQNQRERDVRAPAHAREGAVATANAAPVSLSLSLVASHPSETEPEPEQSQNESADTPSEPETPEAAIHAACVVALGHGPTTGRVRRKWRDGIGDLARLNVTAEDIPKLVRQYHAKYGDSIPCEPWNLADHYSELGVSPHVVSQLYAVGQHHPQHPAPTPEDIARRVRASRVAAGLHVPPKPELDNLGTP